MTTDIAKKLEFILSGTGASKEEFNEIIELMEEYKQLPIHGDSGRASDFEKDLGKLVNDYVKAGLKKPDLIKKMEWMTGNCKFS